MSNGQQLSQDELDAMLANPGVDEDLPDDESPQPQTQPRTQQQKVKTVQQQPFDPASQARVVRERLHTLEVINERFARQFRMNLFNLMRRNADITVDSVRYQRFSDFAENTPSPCNINIVSMKPLRGTALVVFPQPLVSLIVENLFGGDGRFMTRNEPREFTGTEQRIITRVLNLALDAYQESWRAVHPIEMQFLRAEMQPKFAAITSSPSEIVVTTNFHLEVGNLESDFSICMPYAMIEPLRDKLTNLRADIGGGRDDDVWRQLIASELQQSSVELVANFTEIPLRLPQVMSLKPGDVLPIDMPDSVTAKVDGLPVLDCDFGTVDQRHALRVRAILNKHRIPASLLRTQRKHEFTPLQPKDSKHDN
ncbi:flagellar motor switch protein FliM [Pseudidiomarina insulisalsae]|uniref:Flagellar motor switch protein FliM n=1 Tax=Pseudidiomarina insulisalsae TaxID=575789 RepID=A0A432YDH3_9GAMM|nr:flagellar motor switch protein FliM [Pseudidiomarina insulisalsae]RUO59050.1 flagellar motor switch protein FliM [Pseudidiomarina insulisalsae]